MCWQQNKSVLCTQPQGKGLLDFGAIWNVRGPMEIVELLADSHPVTPVRVYSAQVERRGTVRPSSVVGTRSNKVIRDGNKPHRQ